MRFLALFSMVLGVLAAPLLLSADPEPGGSEGLAALRAQFEELGPDVFSDEPIRMNQIQIIGTHNSYHVAPSKAVLGVIGKMNEGWREALDYTHRPLPEQFGELGVRQIELDVFADPAGGHYSTPMLAAVSGGNGDPEGQLKKPGMKVLHIQDIDFRTTVPTLRIALGQIREWSRANLKHVPILVLLELMDDQPNPVLTKPVKFDDDQIRAVEAEVWEVFEEGDVVTPDVVRGGAKSLRDAVLTKGWPALDGVRGKVMFALDNGGRIRDSYVEGNPSFEGRLLFATVGEDDPGAAFFKINDPVEDFERIRRLVRAGFLVRTRADAGTAEARANDVRRRDQALASGAQFVSTDYPEADGRLSKYRVGFGKGVPVRANPVSGSGVAVEE